MWKASSLLSSSDVDIRSVSIRNLFIPSTMRRQSSVRAFCVPAVSVAEQKALRKAEAHEIKETQGHAAKDLGLEWPRVAKRDEAALWVSALYQEIENTRRIADLTLCHQLGGAVTTSCAARWRTW